MRVYHASNTRIYQPDTLHSRIGLDFGKGFYVTKIKEQAEKYAERFLALGFDAYIHEYDFSLDEGLSIKIFDSYGEEWLNFVCNCRRGGEEYKAFDIIMGGVANDKVFRTIELYMTGDYTKEQALNKLIYQKPNHQMAFISQKAIDRCLNFIDCQIIKS